VAHWFPLGALLLETAMGVILDGEISVEDIQQRMIREWAFFAGRCWLAALKRFVAGFAKRMV